MPKAGAERQLYGPFCTSTHPLHAEQRWALRGGSRFKGVRLQVAYKLLRHAGSSRVTARALIRPELMVTWILQPLPVIIPAWASRPPPPHLGPAALQICTFLVWNRAQACRGHAAPPNKNLGFAPTYVSGFLLGLLARSSTPPLLCCLLLLLLR